MYRYQRGLEALDVPNKTFEHLERQWFEVNVISNPRRSLKDHKSIIGRHLSPFFGKKFLNAITLSDIESLTIKKKHEGLTPKTINNILVMLRSMLNYAHQLKWLARVPKIPIKAFDPRNQQYA